MIYNIHYRSHVGLGRFEHEQIVDIGIEIKPPLSETALKGLCAFLENPSGEDVRNDPRPLARRCVVTRNDQEGDALFIRPNPHRVLSPEGMANAIGRLIDPCGIHNILPHSHD